MEVITITTNKRTKERMSQQKQGMIINKSSSEILLFDLVIVLR